MQGSSALREEMQLGGFGLVLKVKEGDWILFSRISLETRQGKSRCLGPQAGRGCRA